MKIPRGIRNNNPGNIRWGSNWQGLLPIDQRNDADFCQFTHSIYGLRAIVRIMLTYREKYGLNTIESIIYRYAPPNENNTSNYIHRVCNKLGISAKQPITLSPRILNELVKSIVAVENGNTYYDHYSNELIDQAIQLAMP